MSPKLSADFKSMHNNIERAKKIKSSFSNNHSAICPNCEKKFATTKIDRATGYCPKCLEAAKMIQSKNNTKSE